ncbi:O-antigen ligase family protein [Siminovitchia terrae]|uniref:O-antigen ligase family protein n=1 Tax=Siminovitchia terrae TaxID=1914933 RepID=UPI001B1FD9EF|nr:O-antigen ligase family protein [Siminovitchia terrae]GIN92569.1 polysaccharide polymerase [Siminovitchia terrae]
MEYKINQDETLFFEKFLILVMVLFFGFTSLRFGMVGIGEVILLFFCVSQILRQESILISLQDHIFSVFWILFLYMVTLGFIINSIFDISLQSVSFDYKAYIVILFLCFTFESIFKKRSSLNLNGLLRFIFFGGLIVVGILYLFYVQGIYQIFGYYLTYGGAEIFSPFANDYHQFAYFLSPLPFVGLYIIKNENRYGMKFIAALGIVLYISAGIATSSNTLVSSWVNTTLLFFILMIWGKLKRQYKSTNLILLFVCFVLLALLFSYEGIIAIVKQFFEDSSNGEHRILLWINALKAWKYSPIVGLGPGSYTGNVVFGGYEAHNTFLQILTQGGILAALAYLAFIFRLIKVTRLNLYILCATVTLIMYGFGINDLRRTVLWFYFILFYFLCMNTEKEKAQRGA